MGDREDTPLLLRMVRSPEALLTKIGDSCPFYGTSSSQEAPRRGLRKIQGLQPRQEQHPTLPGHLREAEVTFANAQEDIFTNGKVDFFLTSIKIF